MKYGYFNYDPVGASVFYYIDEKGVPKETQLNVDEPAYLVEAISSLINLGQIDCVLCNKAGLTLAEMCKNYLMAQYNYNKCEFKLND